MGGFELSSQTIKDKLSSSTKPINLIYCALFTNSQKR